MQATLEQTVPVVSQHKTPLFQKILVVMGMMSLMGGTLTGVMTYLNLGFSDTFLLDWLTSFSLAAVTIMPIGFTLMTLLTKLSEKVMSESTEAKRNLIVGIMMALIMESGMAFTTAVNNIGFSLTKAFLNSWFLSLIGALPVALVLMSIVSMTIKPKVERFLKS